MAVSIQVTAIRIALRLLPPPLRERWAARLFMMRPHHGEPERERVVRVKGEEVIVAGLKATAFGQGPAALLMHGWAGRGLQLSAYIDPLVAAGHRVYALDGPGHGMNHPGLGALPTFAAFLEAAIEELDPTIIVAHSMGAGAAVAAASRTQTQARILALGGPPELPRVLDRARAFMRLPDSGWERFMGHMARLFEGYRTDDVMDIEACARAWGGEIHAVLAAEDEEIPVEESKRIVEAAGGTCTVLGVGHRNVMWKPQAVDAGLGFLLPALKA